MIITIHLKPNAKISKVTAKLADTTFAIAIHAPATDGQANTELIKFLSDKLAIPKTFINLKRGHHSRVKHVEIPDGTSLNTLQ